VEGLTITELINEMEKGVGEGWSYPDNKKHIGNRFRPRNNSLSLTPIKTTPSPPGTLQEIGVMLVLTNTTKTAA
jgi:hypothetical protein